MTTTTSADLLHLADANLAEVTSEHARWLPPYQVEEQQDLLLTASGTRFPGPWNAALACGPAPADPERTLQAARDFFTAKGRGGSVYVRAHLDQALAGACERASYPRMSDAPGMVLDRPVAAPQLVAGVELRIAQSPAMAADFVQVVASAYETIQLPAAVTRKVFSAPERWLTPRWQIFVVYEQEQPVATAMLYFSHGIAGVYWVATVAQARGRGHATAVMRAISNRGFESGARAVVLQATPFGEPVYRRLGYREFTRYPWYLMPNQNG